jgi:NarL family two-component system sensor histidine kinase LiaS
VVRIVREGLQNVVRHAGATRVKLVARRARGRLSLILSDDGRGFDSTKVAESVHGYGLASMRRRVQLIGGRFRLVTSPGHGTRVEISIPAD